MVAAFALDLNADLNAGTHAGQPASDGNRTQAPCRGVRATGV